MKRIEAARAARWMVLMALTLSQTVWSDELSAFDSRAEVASIWRLAAQKYQVNVVDLYAIALQESRRRGPDGSYRAWPWTLNSKVGGPMFFETYEAASKKLNEIIGAGETNVDIGLMGVNWHFHRHRVSDPASLLLPSNNIPIAAQIYKEHLVRFAGDRHLALARYHNGRRELGFPYAASVLSIADYLSGAANVQLALTN